jgi:DNA (cytosine-5)-methyltransferase 1
MRGIVVKTLVDLFAGAGGLSCGLEMAGFRPLLA